MESDFIWIFGSSVQDITVDIDLDALAQESKNVQSKIRFSDRQLLIRKGLWLRTRIGSDRYALQIDIPDIEPDSDGMYHLPLGKKYSLAGEILDNFAIDQDPNILLPGETVSWGGGGINVATFLRALVPSPDKVPIKYTDVAMAADFALTMQALESLRGELLKEVEQIRAKSPTNAHRSKRLSRRIPAPQSPMAWPLVDDLLTANRLKTEQMVAKAAAYAARYSPDRSLDVYLASLRVENVPYRPQRPRFRRNLVIRKIRTLDEEVSERTIFKGFAPAIPKKLDKSASSLFKTHAEGVAAIMLNTVYDQALFDVACQACKRAMRHNSNVVAVVAMTESTQKLYPRLLKQLPKSGRFPLVLVFNEEEAFKYAKKVDKKLQPFMEKGDDLPDLSKFARLAELLRAQFPPDKAPRIYVTLGRRGSLGIEEDGTVVYTSCYNKPGAILHDKNACGDAFCAAITLLEWAKRNGYPNVGGVPKGRLSEANEMRYFMEVATAAAYCKATNRHGHVVANEVQDLLKHEHLASDVLFTVAQLKKKQRPSYASDDYLRRPLSSKAPSVTKTLQKIMELGDLPIKNTTPNPNGMV